MNLFRQRLLRRAAWFFHGWVLLQWVSGVALAGLPEKGVHSFASRLWQREDGLPHNAVQAVAQTPDGYLWVGTQDGLARFDGTEFEPVELPGTHPKRHWINALLAAPDGALWIATGGDGIYEFQHGRFTRHSLSNRADATVLSLLRDAEGGVWAGTRGGTVRLQDGRVEHFPNSRALTVDTARALALDDGGQIWVGVAGSLMQVTNGVVAAQFTEATGLPNRFIRVLCRDREGNLWIGSNGGISRFREGRFEHFSKSDGLPDNNVTAIYEDRRGQLWIGTAGGLCRRVNEKFHIKTLPDGEPYDQIYSFIEDREGNLWVGSKEGLARLTVQQFSTFTSRHGLAHNNIISVLEDRRDALWVGTWGGGLHRFHNGQVEVFSSANWPLMRNNLILALHEAKDGSLWFGTDYNGGLYRLADGILSHFTHKDGLSSNAIRDMQEDRYGALWVGTSSKVFKKRGDRFFHYKQSDGLANDHVRCIAKGAGGWLWVGTEGGLSLWQNGTFTSYTTADGLSDNMILGLYADADRALWIGTQQGGLNRFKDGQFTAYRKEHGLFSDQVLEIVEDDSGRLWMTCNRGVFRVSKAHLEQFDRKEIKTIPCEAFGKADGMVSPVCVGIAKPSSWKTRDGRLWFATSKGLVATDPDFTVEKNTVAPPVVIKRVLAEKQEVFPSSAKSIGIGPGRGELEFHYAALSFRAPERTRFFYQLEGLDAGWVDAGNRRTAYYNNVPPGRYAFRVKAANEDGVWNETGAELEITLEPRFWQTWWFAGLLWLTSAGVVAGGARFITRRRMKQKLLRLKQEHALERERSRIARDIHDDVGANLTQISLLSELVRRDIAEPKKALSHAEKIALSAREVVEAMDEIVWAVNPKNDDLGRMAAYVFQHAEQFLKVSGIRCRLDRPDTLPGIPVSADVRHNVFLVVKEALNNIVKHSGATEVWLRLSFANGLLKMAIEDNGKGFNPDQAGDAFGNGLANMRRRLEEVGGCLEMKSAPERGASVMLSLRLSESCPP